MPTTPDSDPVTALPLAVAVEMMQMSVWRINLLNGRVYANAHGFAMAGIYDPPPIGVGLPLALLRDNVHPDDLARITAAAQQALEPGAGVVDAVARYRQPDGSYRTLLSRRYAERDATGRAIGLLGCSLDVTDQHEARERMHDAERRAAMAAQFAGFGVWQYDLVTGERYWDAQMFRLRGVDPATNPDLDEVRIATTSDEGRAAMQASMDEIARRVNDRDLPENYEPTTVEFEIIRVTSSRGCSRARRSC